MPYEAHYRERDLPSLSIITVALNCEAMLHECYASIVAQDYPKEKVELILVDGGSSDGTVEVARKWGARVVDGGYKENQEARRFVGFLNARNEILVYIDSDNLLPEKDWLKKMVRPFIEDGEIVATQTWRYGYEKRLSITNRYFALFGMNDPVAYYLGKADRLSWFEDRWRRYGDVVSENEGYIKVRFDTATLPTVGCNGFLVRRGAFERLNLSPEEFFHIDVNYDLVETGLCYYGIVKTSLVHATADTLFGSIRKRMRYMATHHQGLASRRRYRVFDSRRRTDVLNLVKFVFFSITVVKPLYESIRGFMRIRDLAWFVHPFACIFFVFGYSIPTAAFFFKGRKWIIRW